MTLGLAFVLMLRPFFPELVISTDLLSFEHPSVLLFCFWITIVNFPWLKGDVSGLLSYGIDSSLLVRFTKCCSTAF